MGKMKRISQYCEKEDLEGLAGYLERNTSYADSAIGVAAGFIIAHKRMRDKSEDEAYKVLNEIHNKLQREEEK